MKTLYNNDKEKRYLSYFITLHSSIGVKHVIKKLNRVKKGPFTCVVNFQPIFFSHRINKKRTFPSRSCQLSIKTPKVSINNIRAQLYFFQ